MLFDNFKTYGAGYREAFETLNNQLFERYILRNYKASLQKLKIINGSGGDGGVEAVAYLTTGIIAIQSKWFLQSLGAGEIKQIRNSINSAKLVRKDISEYIICIPHNVHSEKIGKGKKITTLHEEARIKNLTDEMQTKYPGLALTWWYEKDLLNEIQQPDNEGVHKYWFEQEIITLEHLQSQFQHECESEWLKLRYIPALHGSGIIKTKYDQLIFAQGYQKKLINSLEENVNRINHCAHLIGEFLRTKEFTASIKSNLKRISSELKDYAPVIELLQLNISTGNQYYRPGTLDEVSIWPTILLLQKMSATQRQKAILPDLIETLKDIHSWKLHELLQDSIDNMQQRIKMVRGMAGTGKTHGLADCVKNHLHAGLPAIIIQAKGTPCSDWSEILSKALELPNWTKDEILSALEFAAIRKDIATAAGLPKGEEIRTASSKVLICVDGLEEDTMMEGEWCSRIAGALLLASKYPRVRFVFSAREYFKRNCIDAYDKHWEEIDLPAEGDTPVMEVLPAYFKKYDITIEDDNQIAGLDNLLALHLFCGEYQGKKLDSKTKIVTATGGLLKLKLKRINDEFLASLPHKKGVTREWVKDALVVIAEFFYFNSEIEHNELQREIQVKMPNAFSADETDLLLDFLVKNAIVLRRERTDQSNPLVTAAFFYQIAYQSLIEYIITEKVFRDIKLNKLKDIPPILFNGMKRPLHAAVNNGTSFVPPNLQIIQNIVVRLYLETGQLIGDNDFLSGKLPEDLLQSLRYHALTEGNQEKNQAYKREVDQLFFGTPEQQYLILEKLIIPSCAKKDSSFGSAYLHNILSTQVSVFERDKLWSGLDKFEASVKKEASFTNNVADTIQPQGDGAVFLTGFEKYNQKPLLFAWALTNIDRKLRNAIRIALTGWAVKNPGEFVKLLQKVFDCGDPQMQEDLASVMLGVSGHLHQKDALQPLAEWSLKNIFMNLARYRNIIIRQGFRAIVERAFRFGATGVKELNIVRPPYALSVEVLKFDKQSLRADEKPLYPITNDLCWYVIENAYSDFLEYPSQQGRVLKNNDGKEAKQLLDLYRAKYKRPGFYAKSWTMVAALAYIKKELGLTRKKGNGWTQETHGSKSKLYTYEEKYTWLAVHYLKGYLSDYMPLKSRSGKGNRVKDYTQISEIPNPGGEAITDANLSGLIKNSHWVIKEDLTPTIKLSGNTAKNIENWVKQEPGLHFNKWLLFKDADFKGYNEAKQWLALNNNTSLFDASQTGYSRFTANACFVHTSKLAALKKLFQKKSDRELHFAGDNDHMHASPDTGTYSNPTDIVWMDWLEEYSDGAKIILPDQELKVFYSIVGLTQETVNGEKHYNLPSRLVRNLLDISTFAEPDLLDARMKVAAFINKKSDGSFRDSQELVLANQSLLLPELKKKSLAIFWVIEVFKRNNVHNDAIKEIPHARKVRKYFAWMNGSNIKSFKFWDESFSNQRDR